MRPSAKQSTFTQQASFRVVFQLFCIHSHSDLLAADRNSSSTGEYDVCNTKRNTNSWRGAHQLGYRPLSLVCHYLCVLVAAGLDSSPTLEAQRQPRMQTCPHVPCSRRAIFRSMTTEADCRPDLDAERRTAEEARS